MASTRRDILVSAAASLVGRSATQAATIGSRPAIKAIAFDAFPVFDPRPVFVLAEELFPGKGAELSDAWRTRQFEYTWLRTAMHRYADFWQVTNAALRFAAKTLRLDLTEAKRARLMAAYLELKPWPDAAAALRSMRGA